MSAWPLSPFFAVVGARRISRSWSAGIEIYLGDGKGGWHLVEDSGLPSKSLSVIESITLADVDHDGFPEIIALNGGNNGAITMWKRR